VVRRGRGGGHSGGEANVSSSKLAIVRAAASRRSSLSLARKPGRARLASSTEICSSCTFLPSQSCDNLGDRSEALSSRDQFQSWRNVVAELCFACFRLNPLLICESLNLESGSAASRMPERKQTGVRDRRRERDSERERENERERERERERRAGARIASVFPLGRTSRFR